MKETRVRVLPLSGLPQIVTYLTAFFLPLDLTPDRQRHSSPSIQMDFRSNFFEFAFQNRTVFDALLSFLPPSAIVNLAKSTSLARCATHSYIRRAFDIHRHLLRFFDNPLAFRELQQRTGMLVSGSSAVQFMGRFEFPGSDMDLYVEARYGAFVGEWLMANGYEFSPTQHQQPEFSISIQQGFFAATHLPADYIYLRGIHNVYTFFEAGVAENEERRKVQLITASRTPIEVIVQFHTTCVMNIISHSHAYSFYPHATFTSMIALTVYNPRDTVRGLRRAHDKWRARGWDIIPYQDAAASQEQAFRSGLRRWIGDGYTWTLPLDTTERDARLTEASDYMSLNSWFLSPNMASSMVAARFTVISSPALRFNYLAPEDYAALMRDTLYIIETHRSRVGGEALDDYDAIIEHLATVFRKLTARYADKLKSLLDDTPER